MSNASLPSVGIIGAGISGLLAARVLVHHQIPHWIIEKSRGVGGRMATRRIGEGIVDHGAQYFTARDAAFRAIVDEALQHGVLRQWASGFRLDDGSLKTSDDPRFIAPRGMNSFPRSLADELDITLSTQAAAIRHDGEAWLVDIADAPPRRASTLLVTCPAPQAIALLAAGEVQLPGDTHEALAAIRYDPSFALLVVSDSPSAIPDPGGLWPSEGPFSWIADNRQKGISPLTTITFHTRPEFSRSRLDDDRDLIARELLDAARPYLNGNIIEHQLHRWLYSIPTVTHPARFLACNKPGTILLAGDAFGGPRVEGAALSGLAAGDYICGAWKNSS